MQINDLTVVILAAGKGTRMRSKSTKVLQKIAAKPMIFHLLETIKNIPEISRSAVIYGFGGDEVTAEISANFPETLLIEQKEQLGTANAVKSALEIIPDNGATLVLLGDTPLLQKHTITEILQAAETQDLVLLSAILDNPKGYGRIIRENNFVTRIVEEKDANSEEKLVKEINTGVMLIDNQALKKNLIKINNKNAQQEYYLTDIISLIKEYGGNIAAVVAQNTDEVLGINDRIQLAQAEKIYQNRLKEELMRQGVTLIDPERTYITGEIQAGIDVIIEPNCTFKGKVTLGDGVFISSNTVIENAEIGENTKIEAMSVIENATIGKNCQIGPFARIRPQSTISDQAKIGNFVEVKASVIGYASKVNHLSYIGDSHIGAEVNIGAGTITCNYDGANKHRTTIGDRVFIGSNSALVAPVAIADGATIGAGSVITKNVSAEILAFTRPPLKEVKNWQRPKKNK
ncbi:MAG: bifunctional UDP-N-acetylglucosamine diphosphorylase/glucosamine-1-phosphate N-acetyltransferase GlmU [Cardiobacteriaceae bacterium]|nr:bifunctional UDP-N-acetylglucosamine diphosphorylase/glucosamine-1-phosphate N-acetyltransferase GlmU [Cardiobacteriaceae bacterium]